MSKKSQRYKRRAEMERQRADSAIPRAQDRVRNLLGGRTFFKLVVRLPNGEKLTVPQAVTNCFTLTEERFRGDRIYAELDVGVVGPTSSTQWSKG